MLPATGSTITAAIASGSAVSTRFTEARSLNVAVLVKEASAAGTPGLSGTPIANAPEPALMRNESPWPW